MHISDLIVAVETIAPPCLAEEWDNVGLLIGSASWELEGPVLLTIDLTEEVAREAEKKRCSAVIAYHPPIFHAIKRLTDGPGSGGSERVALRMARAGIAVYSPHTALDAAAGGVTDWLADGLGGEKCGDRRALRSSARRDPNQEVKIVTFVPAEAADKVRDALATAGAGLIGNYSVCSFSSEGTGTFRGNERSSPRVGKAERLESASELRLEMVCSRRALALAITTLRQFHPYEEPAIDLYPLEPKPDRRLGVGRRLMLDHPVGLGDLADRLKKHLGAERVQVAGAGGGGLGRKCSCIGIVPGAGGSVAMLALGEGCEVFVTGEMKHHEVAAATAAGLSVILGGHTATERGYLPRFAAMLRKQLPGAKFIVSVEDRDPVVSR
jgi:dinuclear metal center YbgI/SA1388 family protein